MSAEGRITGDKSGNLWIKLQGRTHYMCCYNDSISETILHKIAEPSEILVGRWVKVITTFTPKGNSVPKELEKGILGNVIEIDGDGDAKINFEGVGHQFLIKSKDHFHNISMLEMDKGTFHTGMRVHKSDCKGKCCGCQKRCAGSCGEDTTCSGDCQWTCCGKKGRNSSWPGCHDKSASSGTP